eukprot:4947131-Pyramimonas_sp.AAC.1
MLGRLGGRIGIGRWRVRLAGLGRRPAGRAEAHWESSFGKRAKPKTEEVQHARHPCDESTGGGGPSWRPLGCCWGDVGDLMGRLGPSES